MSKAIDDARQLIQSRLADLDAEAKSLESALTSLGEGSNGRGRRPGRPRKAASTNSPSAPPKRRRPRKRKAAKRAAGDAGSGRKPTRRKPSKRAPRGQRREQLLAAIKAGPGARPTELAKAIGVKSTQVHALIAKARAEKLIVKRGNGYALRA